METLYCIESEKNRKYYTKKEFLECPINKKLFGDNIYSLLSALDNKEILEGYNLTLYRIFEFDRLVLAHCLKTQDLYNGSVISQDIIDRLDDD